MARPITDGLDLALIMRTVGEPLRLELVRLLAAEDREWACSELQARLGLPASTGSYHLRLLREAGVTVEIGQRTEAVVLAELVRRGYRVLTPFGVNHRYDLAIDLGDRFVRVQCKTGRIRNGSIIFSTRSVRSNRQGWFVRDYGEHEIDLFMVFCPELRRVYAVPVEDAPAGYGTLRVAPTANRQSRGIRWAADFELPA